MLKMSSLPNVYSFTRYTESYAVRKKFNPLRILMWKHYKERKRRVFLTIWETLSGVLIFSMVVACNIFYDHLIDSTSVKQMIDEIFFLPHSNLTKSYMHNIKDELLNKDNFSNLSGAILRARSFRRVNDVVNHVNSLNSSKLYAIINFKDFNGQTLPNELNYTIELLRPRNSTNNVLRLRAPTIYTYPFSTLTTPSVLSELQWAIDKVFMQHLSGENITHDINLNLKEDVTNVFLQLAIFSILSIYATLAPLPFFLINSSRLVNIRRSGLKELMRMVGISPNIFRLSHLLDTALIATVYSLLNTLALKVTAKPILKSTNAVIVFVTFILQMINIKTLTFITSTLTQDYAHSGGVTLLIYLVTMVLDTPWLSFHVKCTPYVYVLCLIFPHLPMNLFWYEITYMENMGTGTNFSTIIRCGSGICFSVLHVWLFFVLQILVTTTLGWYLDLVRPGKYGMAEKWNFLCQKRFWKTKKKVVTFHVTAEQTVKLLRDERFFQKGPSNAEVVVKVIKVTKVFKVFRHRDIVALDHVSLDLYRGEVTMLLGPNGAGKTSLLSIITGMYSATHGKVYVKGLDNVKRIQEIRQDIGFCPQHNMTFDYLTVRENIVFFQRLRGINAATQHVHGSVDKLLSKLKLISKADCYSYQLSLGMKRCLQMAIALACGAEVLVLDEPTSGMDSPSRHSLWDLLLTLRGHVSILMTTTCLGEADVLGDRIAFLVEGKLKCYGTPSFLKNAIGTGFNLSLTLNESNKVVFVEDEVRKVVNLATSKMLGKKIIFTLPLKDRELFPQLFDMLEEKKSELTITAMEIGMAIDEFFMEFVDEEEDVSEYILTPNINLEETKLKGFKLHSQQIGTLLRRNFKFLMTRKIYVTVFQVLIPMLIIIFGTLQTNGTDTSYIKHSEKHTLYYNMGPYRKSAVMNLVNRSHPRIEAFESLNVTKEMMNLIHKTYNRPNIRLTGIEMGPDKTHLFVPIQSQSSVTDAINIFSNIYMSLHMPYIAESGIRSSYKEFRADDDMNYPKSVINCYFWTLAIMFSVTFVLTPLVWMSIREYQNGVRYNHVIAGCPPVLHWMSKLIFHMTIYLIAVPITVLLASVFLEKDHTINQLNFLLAVTLMLLLFAPAFLVHLYVLSFIFDENDAVTYIYDMSICFGVVSPLLHTTLLELWDIGYKVEVFLSILTAITHISPVFTLEYGLLDLVSVARMNSYCCLNKHLCPNIVLPVLEGPNNVNKTCCESSSTHPYEYYTGYENGLQSLVILIAQFFTYCIFLQMLQNGILQRCTECLYGCKYKEPSSKYNHSEVIREKLYVKEKMAIHPQPNSDVLIVENLHKNFISFTERQPYSAVKGVSFALKQGECLGIFGPSGSGKTSILYMITGFSIKSKGDAWAGGYFFNNNRNKYLGNIALATAFGIDEFLSGFENLTLISELHGHCTKEAEKLALYTLNSLGLQTVSHARCSTYSHGCLQRLAVCGALLVEPLVALFDEPAKSVDPRARPLIARALTRIVDTGRPIVLIEHNMNWQLIETLCDRIAIMLHGEVAVMGKTHAVREAVASGYSARLKLWTNVKITRLTDYSTDEEMETMSHTRMLKIRRVAEVEKLKLEFETQFDCVLIAEHMTTLYYHINSDEKPLSYSTMFTKLETLKSTFDHILEDYFLSETSIEDVFRKINESSRTNYAK